MLESKNKERKTRMDIDNHSISALQRVKVAFIFLNLLNHRQPLTQIWKTKEQRILQDLLETVGTVQLGRSSLAYLINALYWCRLKN